MSAISQIPAFFPTEFATNWEHLVQQKTSRLKDYVTLTTINGKDKTFNQIGALSMQRVSARAGDTRQSDVALDKRWIRPFPYDLSQAFDEWDEEFLGDIVLPTSDVMQAHIQAYGRTCDQVIIDGLGGTAYSGENGTTTNDLGNSNKVAVNFVAPNTTGSNSGLTLAKLIKAKSILGKNEVDKDDPLIFAYTQQQLDDLLNNVNEVKSSDYNQVKALVDGEVDTFMGFKFVRLELLPKASTVRTCFAYAKSGVKFGTSGRKSHMDVLPTQSHALQVRTVASLAATRSEEKKVVAVYCDEGA